MKLFMIYLGGTAPGANIEVHDVRFATGSTIEDTYPLLIQQWFGTKKGLHLDSYLAVHHVDGYRIELVKEPVTQKQRLWFVNFGGYYAGRIAEYHEFTLCVAETAKEAKQMCKARLLTDSIDQHKDDLMAVDDCLSLDLINGWYVKLTHDGGHQALEPDWSGYHVIGY